MRLYSLIIICLLTFLMGGCVVVGDNREVTGPFDQRLKLDIEYYNALVQRVRSAGRQEIVLNIGLVPGKLIGPLEGQPVVQKRQFDYEPLELSLKDYLQTIETRASPLVPSDSTLGLRSEPREARFIRINSEVFASSTNKRIGDGLFIYKPFGEFVFPAYFDRECEVRGVVSVNGVRYVHNIFVQEPGLYWIIQREFVKGEYSLEILNINRDIGFAIIPDESIEP